MPAIRLRPGRPTCGPDVRVGRSRTESDMSDMSDWCRVALRAGVWCGDWSTPRFASSIGAVAVRRSQRPSVVSLRSTTPPPACCAVPGRGWPVASSNNDRCLLAPCATPPRPCRGGESRAKRASRRGRPDKDGERSRLRMKRPAANTCRLRGRRPSRTALDGSNRSDWSRVTLQADAWPGQAQRLVRHVAERGASGRRISR